jgi:hypothetical protein
LIVGSGRLGGLVLQQLVSHPSPLRLALAGRDRATIEAFARSAEASGSIMGRHTLVETLVVDLLEPGSIAQALRAFRPTLIFNSTTLQTPSSLLGALPPALRSRIYGVGTGFAPWISFQLPLLHNLMRVARIECPAAVVVNAGFPDGTHAALSRRGLAPDVGIGNLHVLHAFMVAACASILDCPAAELDLALVAHHVHAYHWPRAEAGDAPCWLSLKRSGREVSGRIDRSTLVSATARATRRPPGDASQYIVAASAAAVLSALLSKDPRLMHLPGPLGLEGGYPVSVSRHGVALALPASMTRAEARDLMVRAQRFDGIDSIDDRGDIRLTAEARDVLRSVLGIEADAVTLENAQEFGAEFRAKLAELGTRVGVGV